MDSTNRLLGFPKATEKNEVIYHNGLTDEEIETAESLGYRLEDVRFISGVDGVKAALQGIRMRTVRMDAGDVAALRAEAEVWQKLPEGMGSNESADLRAVEDMLGDLRGSTNYASLWQEPEAKPKGTPSANGGGFWKPKRPRGRPPKNPRPEEED